MSTGQQDEEGKSRRAILKGLCSLTVGASLGTLSFRLLRDERSLGQIELRVQEHAPAGGVFLHAKGLGENTDFRLWVRRVSDGVSAVADRCSIRSSEAEVELILDLPDEHWVAGDYELRLDASQQGDSSYQWQSPWVHAFTLRAAVWQG